MNFYAFNIGDYAGKTRHLTWDEDLAYRRLLDAYYAREAPLPLDLRQIYRLVLAATPEHREAVDAVLREFFETTEDGYRHSKCDEIIAQANEKKSKAKASAEKRWSNANAMQTHYETNANASSTAYEGNAPNPNPNPNPNKDSDRILAREPLADLEVRLRQAAGWQSEPAPRLSVTGPMQALIDQGVDLDLDMLPTVKALAPTVRSRTSWKYFEQPCLQARDARLSAITAANAPPQETRRHASSKTTGRSTFELIAEAAERSQQPSQGDAGEPGSGDEIYPPRAFGAG